LNKFVVDHIKLHQLNTLVDVHADWNKLNILDKVERYIHLKITQFFLNFIITFILVVSSFSQGSTRQKAHLREKGEKH
jgi:hypothetical protein